jgi:cellulose biosynthesis protein BcsQ
MSAPVIAFFNNKGGVGKTTLVYHLAWMFAFQGKRVVAADLDPQANLTASFLDEAELEELWPENGTGDTVYGNIEPLQKSRPPGDITGARLWRVGTLPEAIGDLALIAGDLGLSSFEDDLSSEWPKCLDGRERSFRVISAFGRLLREAADRFQADVVLLDVGPNLGAINRSALVASDYVVVPLAPDLFSIQGLRNLGPRLRDWRREWETRRTVFSTISRGLDFDLPIGAMLPLGYVVLGHGVRLNRPVHAYQRWIQRVPNVFRDSVLGITSEEVPEAESDPYCLAQLKHYHSLIQMGMEAYKPVFALKPADGAFGGHLYAAQRAFDDFSLLADTIIGSVGQPDRSGAISRPS